MKKIAAAYGLWLAGVVSAALAAWLLYRSRAITFDAQDELEELELEHELD